MGTAGQLLAVVGVVMLGMTILMRTLRDLPPDPRASEKRQVEARRASYEIQTVIVPWTRRLGLAAVVAGLLLALIDLIV